MKKFYLILTVAAAIAATTLASCTKDDGKNKKDNGPDFSEVVAEFSTEAKKIELPTQDVDDAKVVKNKAGEIVKAIEFTESGYAIITKLVPRKATASVSTKADESAQYEEVTFVTTFTTSDGKTFTVTGFGTVKVETSATGATTVTVTATAASGDDAVASNVEAAPATVTAPAASSDKKNDIYKSWKITVTEVEAKGGSLDKNGVKKKFTTDANSLDAMAIWLKEKGVKFDEKVEGYVIESVTLTEAGTFMVKFNVHEPYVGEFKLSGKTFTYEFSQGGNKVLNAKADGSVEVNEKGVATLTLNGTVENGSDKYTTTIILTLEPIAKV